MIEDPNSLKTYDENEYNDPNWCEIIEEESMT